MFEESLALFRDLGDKFNIGLALIGVGQMAERRGDYQAARQVYEESLGIYRELGDKWGTSGALYCLGSAALGQRDYVGARSILEESLAVARELGSPGQIAEVLENLGRAACFLGDYAGAHARYNESLVLFRELGDQYGSALCLADLAGVLVVAGMTTRKAPVRSSKGQGKAEGIALELAIRAAQALGAAQALLDSIGVQLDPMGQELFNSYRAAARTRLGARAFARAWAAGRAMELEQAVAWAQTTPLPQRAETDTQPPAARPMQWAAGRLTSREQEVALRIAEGKSNREIADALVVGERTVEGHVSNILAKLGFRSRAQISAWVIQQGLAGRRH
jgi:non-specific serine/threonine protein kinase